MSRVRFRAMSVPPLLFDAALGLLLTSVGMVQLLAEAERAARRFTGPGPAGGGGGPPPGPFPGVFTGPAPPDTLSYILLAFCGLSLIARRRLPLISLAGVTAFGAAFLYRGEPTFGVQVIVLVSIYSVVADSNLNRLSSIAVSLASAAILGLALHFNDDPARSTALWAMDAAWIIAAIFLGDSVRSRREAAALTELGREEAARRRISEERLQIARELHDVVGHNISLINVQAGAGSHVLYRQPAQAKETFDNIRQASHETLQELRSLVGVLREPLGGEPLTPTVGLDGLDQLIKSVSDAGQQVKLTVSGTRRQLAGIVDLAAYRILQEALTNTVRHAPRSRVDVSVEYGADRVSLNVTNGPGSDGERLEVEGNGHGIVGMHERVTAIGGNLEVGPEPDGGYHVRAILPVGGPST